MRDVSPPSGPSGDDQGDAVGAVGARDPGRWRSGPRHMSAGGDDRVSTGPPWTARRPTPWDGPAAAGPGDDGSGDEHRVDGGAPGGDHPGHHTRRTLRRTLIEWGAVIVGGVLIALVVEAFLVQAFWIPSPSMVPTLQVGDRVLVNKLSYKLHPVHRGDVVVFSRPKEADNGADNNIKDLIKRVIAVGGDTIEARDGRVYVNGRLIDEPYLPDNTRTDNLPRQTVPDGRVFVMGDNRTDSQDSRIFGPIPTDTIVGRAFVKVLPLTDVGWL